MKCVQGMSSGMYGVCIDYFGAGGVVIVCFANVNSRSSEFCLCLRCGLEDR